MKNGSNVIIEYCAWMQSTCVICHYTMAWNNFAYDIHGDWIYWTESTRRYELIWISPFTRNYDFRFKGNEGWNYRFYGIIEDTYDLKKKHPPQAPTNKLFWYNQ
jgi:hypothetical protein